jgi:hypothetical protein
MSLGTTINWHISVQFKLMSLIGPDMKVGIANTCGDLDLQGHIRFCAFMSLFSRANTCLCQMSRHYYTVRLLLFVYYLVSPDVVPIL